MATELAQRPEESRLANVLAANVKRIESVVSGQLTAKRICRLALMAANENPRLLECTPESVLMSVMNAAALGLEISGTLGRAYLVPYWDGEDRCYKAQLIPGYRGLIDLVRRSGQLVSLSAHAVHREDAFEYELGDSERLVHKPKLGTDEERGPIVAFYAVAHLKDGGKQIEVMSRSQVDAVRDMALSKAKRKENPALPWNAHYSEMGRKTVIRRIAKFLPATTEFHDAIALDDHAMAGVAQPNLAVGEVGGIARQIEQRAAAQISVNDLKPAEQPEETRPAGRREQARQDGAPAPEPVVDPVPPDGQMAAAPEPVSPRQATLPEPPAATESDEILDVIRTELATRGLWDRRQLLLSRLTIRAREIGRELALSWSPRRCTLQHDDLLWCLDQIRSIEVESDVAAERARRGPVGGVR